MTRINIIPVEELMDQHLIAEYREITMVPASLARTLSSKTGLDYNKIPKSYKIQSNLVMPIIKYSLPTPLRTGRNYYKYI